MYLPAQFRCSDATVATALMREHPFANLISTDADGFPFMTHLPLHLDENGGNLVLLGHCARSNPHWRYLADRPDALATFMGPHGYLSPRVYPDLQRVPSWNYLAVHCRVRARLVDDLDAKDVLLKKLIADHEPGYAAQWGALDDDFTRRMLAGIVAFELQVRGVECKLKLNQHRPESHAALHAAYAEGNDQERALAGWMEKLGMEVRP